VKREFIERVTLKLTSNALIWYEDKTLESQRHKRVIGSWLCATAAVRL